MCDETQSQDILDYFNIESLEELEELINYQGYIPDEFDDGYDVNDYEFQQHRWEGNP